MFSPIASAMMQLSTGFGALGTLIACLDNLSSRCQRLLTSRHVAPHAAFSGLHSRTSRFHCFPLQRPLFRCNFQSPFVNVVRCVSYSRPVTMLTLPSSDFPALVVPSMGPLSELSASSSYLLLTFVPVPILLALLVQRFANPVGTSTQSSASTSPINRCQSTTAAPPSLMLQADR